MQSTLLASLLEKDRRFIWHPFTQHGLREPLLPVVSAKGTKLFLADGRVILDGISSWWVNVHGHCHPKITEAIRNQAEKLQQVIFAGCTHEPAVTLAETTLSLLGPEFSKVFFSDDGSTAVEVALKMSVPWIKAKRPKARRILALEGCYHGDTFGAMSLAGGDPQGFFSPYRDYLFEVSKLPLPTEENLPESLKILDEILSADDSLCFIYEPLVQGAAGMQMMSAAALDAVLGRLKAAEVCLIADEIFTGFGRTGTMFASEQLQNKPDIICLSKALTGGSLPLSLTCAREEVYQAFLATDRRAMLAHGHSYTANPLACAAANASMEILQTEGTKSALAKLSAWQEEFRETLSKLPGVTNARSLGPILACDLEFSGGYYSAIRDRLYQGFLSEGVLLRPLGNVIYLLPPYCVTEDEMSVFHAAISKVIANL